MLPVAFSSGQSLFSDSLARLIGSGIAWFGKLDKQHDETNYRDQDDQLEPAGFADVVETAGIDTQTGAEDGEGEDTGEDLADAGDQIENKVDHEVDQHEAPESFSAGSAFKAEVCGFDDFEIVVDDSFDVQFYFSFF